MIKSKHGWNPWYELYAEAHGRTPQEHYDHDAQENAPMMAYRNWITSRWSKYFDIVARPRSPEKATQSAFDAWLRKQLEERDG